MSGKSFIFCGGTGVGKTSLIKGRIKNVHPEALHLYDVNAEYKEYYKKPFGSFQAFSKTATKLSDAVIVFEEATIFLDNKGSNAEIREILVKKRHTNNTIFFVFHSLRTVPRWVFDLSNFVVLFKTMDPENLVQSRFEHPNFTECFKRVQEISKQNLHYYEIFQLY